MPGEHHEQALERLSLARNGLAAVVMTQIAVGGQPCELLARRTADRVVLREACEQIVGGHVDAFYV